MSEAPSRSTIRRGRTLKLYLADGTPSGASAAIAGGANNGRITWRVEETGGAT
jgi:hypothetical protein